MPDFSELLERLWQWLFLPASVFGAGGAVMHAARKGLPLLRTLVEAAGGMFTAHMVGPLIAEDIPEKWHYSLFFLVGWGGLELVGRLYEAGASALERRLRRHINPPGAAGGENGE